MKTVLAYLVLVGLAVTAGALAAVLSQLPPVLEPIRVGIACAMVGGLGGCVYCLRGVYLNASVRKQWDSDWLPWYYIRPVVSLACGGVSYLFLRTGLLVLEAGPQPASTYLGFYALAFIAGLNVDKFMVKTEGLAHAMWGVEKSRTAAHTEQGPPKPTIVSRSEVN